MVEGPGRRAHDLLHRRRQRRAGNTGNMFIELKPLPTRRPTADQIITRLRPKLAKVEGIMLYLQSVQDVRSRRARSRGRSTSTRSRTPTSTSCNSGRRKMLERAQEAPELKDVATDQQTAGLQLDVDHRSRHRLAARHLRRRTSTTPSTTPSASARSRPLYTADQPVPRRAGDEARAPSATPTRSRCSTCARRGQQCRSAFSSFHTAATSLSVTHQGQFPAVTLSFNLAPGVALGQAVDAIYWLPLVFCRCAFANSGVSTKSRARCRAGSC